MYDKPITFDKFVRWLGYGLLVLIIIALINYLGSVLLPFAAAWLLAYLLYPMVKFVQYKLHVPGRVLSIVVTLIVVIAILTGIAWLIIPPMIEQFERLSELVTAYIQTTAKIDSIPDAISQWTQEHRRDLEEFYLRERQLHRRPESGPAPDVQHGGQDGQYHHQHRGLAHCPALHVLHPHGLRVPDGELD